MSPEFCLGVGRTEWSCFPWPYFPPPPKSPALSLLWLHRWKGQRSSGSLWWRKGWICCSEGIQPFSVAETPFFGSWWQTRDDIFAYTAVNLSPLLHCKLPPLLFLPWSQRQNREAAGWQNTTQGAGLANYISEDHANFSFALSQTGFAKSIIFQF